MTTTNQRNIAPLEPDQNSSPTHAEKADQQPERISNLRWAFRFLRWSTYLAALVTLALLLHKSSPPPVQASAQAAARAEEKVQEAEQARSQGQKATLRLDESELNSYLANHLDLAKDNAVQTAAGGEGDAPSATDVEQMRSSVRDVKIQMESDKVRAYVIFDVHGKDMTLVLEGKLGAENGFLRFVPVSGQIGSLPIPQSTLEAAVRKMMESPENREKLRLPGDIADLKIENGELVAVYR
jgi:hypothetical protein